MTGRTIVDYANPKLECQTGKDFDQLTDSMSGPSLPISLFFEVAWTNLILLGL
ncbi:hypothetical protein KSU1_C1577 [Candidatus Jettenia caeni]|uniref:Uncharacterized protein n=1 Tax=Candidatus Jettenia caeni TaxID=247490 RepID=I3IN78_9BACT|nr:hypothetical protein [Candidatus Jettenia sp. AMX1]WKZ14854.1 MAG: hypothetical protein QY317_13225 [Candidatus Jettenia caeni]GAB63173.1 hypothetical protein KSU1_C1577 [Candidatus Jettenia caeni]GIL19182.1 MAG: hypothetical protein BroJett041_02960 [Candidatus Jettenia caeni]GJQ45805.1 MAG: hypothetical protein JETCAE04_15590 [Candidatus Jettenia caeni]